MRTLLFLCVGWIVLGISIIAAPVVEAAESETACATGEVQVGDGCCWPGQHWEAEACSGDPQCPSGTVAEDDRCVPEDYPGWYSESCLAGNRASCERLGEDYSEYWQDLEEEELSALRGVMKFGCELGVAESCASYGNMLGGGRGGEEDDAQARKIYEELCDAENPRGCGNLAMYYLSGRAGLEEDPGQARELLEFACEGGRMISCNRLGRLYSRGEGVAQSHDTARKFYERACDGENSWGCYNLAALLRRGPGGVPKNVDRAYELLERTCETGFSRACTGQAMMYLSEEVEGSRSRAIELLELSCDGDHWNGCSVLGFHYDGGTIVEEDRERAQELFRKSCEGSDAECLHLARYYLDGLGGLEQNPSRAAELFAKSCEAQSFYCGVAAAYYGDDRDAEREREFLQRGCDGGHRDNCNALARIYSKEDSEDNRVRARELFERACELESPAGCGSLAFYYRDGTGGKTQDLRRSRELFEEACDGDIPWACRELGQHLRQALGGEVDHERANKVLRKSCDDEDLLGCFRLARQYLNGNGAERDLARARQIFRRGCREEHWSSCTDLGRYYLNHEEEMEETATYFFRKACEGGDAAGCLNLGYSYLFARVPGSGGYSNFGEARRQFRSACEDGNAFGCWELGACYHSGNGCNRRRRRARQLFDKVTCHDLAPRNCLFLGRRFRDGREYWQWSGDKERALDLLGRACSLEYWEGCEELGTVYSKAGEEFSDPREREQLKRACEEGYGRACASLGIWYRDGEVGLEADLARGRSFFESACAGEHYSSCTTAGFMHYGDQGGEGDKELARRYFEQACEGEHAGGCSRLGFLYEHGSAGLAVDVERAEALYEQGCQGGVSWACERIE